MTTSTAKRLSALASDMRNALVSRRNDAFGDAFIMMITLLDEHVKGSEYAGKPEHVIYGLQDVLAEIMKAYESSDLMRVADLIEFRLIPYTCEPTWPTAQVQ